MLHVKRVTSRNGLKWEWQHTLKYRPINLQNSFSGTVRSKFAIRWSLKIPLHFKHVRTTLYSGWAKKVTPDSTILNGQYIAILTAKHQIFV